MNAAGFEDLETQSRYAKHIAPLVRQMPWVLRVTEHKDKPAPVLVVKERVQIWDEEPGVKARRVSTSLRDRGFLYGPALWRCRPVLRLILAEVKDGLGIPLELHQFIADKRLSFRGNLPLDTEAGEKLALLFKLQERVTDMDRVELMAWRIERCTAEEAGYWWSRITQFNEAANRWAQAGLRVLLGGQPGDPAVIEMLQQLRR
ncbi:hypothetical protein [Alicyclobacillus fructus]|uniref:DUF7680 family protein n=1 Tax=Alicyclobacillus fructus TaxID=2816082 RepID=UPI001A90A2A1|nr:hypothetical protein [Alicyclobacillus fructus]